MNFYSGLAGGESKVAIGYLLTKKESVVDLGAAQHILITQESHIAATAVEANTFSF